tara:strand:- start:62 stop:247 length:186 start_codon:yes stop_codon:yes gene_type:complete
MNEINQEIQRMITNENDIVKLNKYRLLVLENDVDLLRKLGHSDKEILIRLKEMELEKIKGE